VRIEVSVANYRLQIMHKGKIYIDVTKRCWSHLEPAFLWYFRDTKRLKLRLTNPQSLAPLWEDDNGPVS
jgi:hypothetical protein